jgi:Uma2 family endonuclease
MAWHSMIMRRIANMFDADGLTTYTETGVVLTEHTVREPDVSRFRTGVQPDLRRSQFAAADIDLVVEIISPESEKRDRLIKPVEYAAAGIPEFWLVEEHPERPTDAIINIYRLGPTDQFDLARTAALSALEVDWNR